MIVERLIGFVEALRAVGIPVSLQESIDASNALEHCSIADREVVHSSLALSLIKSQSHRHVFDELFEVYFSTAPPDKVQYEESQYSEAVLDPLLGLTDVQLRDMVRDLLLDPSEHLLRNALASAVTRFAGIEPGRPVGGVYYAFRTLRHLNMEEMKTSLLAAGLEGIDLTDSLGKKLLNREIDVALERARKLLELEIRRRLVGDRGIEAVAQTLHSTLPEDIDFMQANAHDVEEITVALGPLVRKLASRLGVRRRKGHRGSLDFRRTIRHSMANGGVPVDLAYHSPRIAKPELMVIADVSGSVASFSRFTLLLVYALSGQFSRVRSFVFIDEIDEVTGIFDATDDMNEALRQLNTEARVVGADGHSDYGRVFDSFVERWGSQLNARTTVLLLGDARNNYHSSGVTGLASIRANARALHWLNPEPASYWDSGDSIMGEYAPFVDTVNECRNLRQLQHFVATLA